MAGIFLSYSRADRPVAQKFAEALQEEGFTVWWDKVLRAGQTYDEVTENMLRDSAVVVVLWSHTSVKSKWVRAEATLGERTAAVIPAMIEDAERPIMFELTQSADLIGWDGDRTDKRWKGFVTDVRQVIEQAGAESAPVAREVANDGADDASIETVFWTSIKDGQNPADFEAYLKRYPSGHYVDLARNRLTAMSPAPAAMETPPPAPAPRAAEPRKPEKPAKKSSSVLPKLIGAAALLGLAGWAATTVLPGLGGGKEQPPEPVPVCENCPEMVAIAAGTFTMGSPSGEANRSGNEGPQRAVTIPAFAISKTEITQSQWAACAAAEACAEKAMSGDGLLPVAGVSWNEANTYTSWLSATSTRQFRLPTEAEWEYAARAGTTTAYWWGPDFNRGITNGARPADVTSLRRNPFELAGMLGNVREWVEDCYINTYRNSPSDGRADLSGDCSRRVVRGGSWKNGAAQHRAANRARVSVDVNDRSIGFRVVEITG